MALPTTITSRDWPTSGSGNLGPFLYNGNVYVVVIESTKPTYLSVYKATDPTSSFSEQDGSNHPASGAISYFDAILDGSAIRILGLTSGSITQYYEFDCSTDTWVDVVGDGNYYFGVYTPTDFPTTHWGGITVRSDGDIIIVHPGENPTTMGGTYQEVAYSRMEYDGATSFTDGTNGLNLDIDEGSVAGDAIIRNDAGSWVTAGFAVGDIIEITNAEDSGNSKRYEIQNIFTTSGTNDSLRLRVNDLAAQNTLDTTAVVTLLYRPTTGVVVASTATKNDNYFYAYPVMGSSDQCHFAYVRDTNADFYLRALSSGNSLRTQRTHAGSFNAGVHGGVNFTRSSTEKIAFAGAGASASPTAWKRIYFTHFTDDSSPTFTEESITILASASSNSYNFNKGIAADDIATNQDNYFGVPFNSDLDIYLLGDDGGTTWSDQNSSTAIRTGTVDGISANIYTRGGNRVYAFLYDDAGTVKYDEFILYGVGGGIVFTRRPMRFLSRSF